MSNFNLNWEQNLPVDQKKAFEESKKDKDRFIRELFALALDEYERQQKKPYAHPDDSFIAAFNLLEIYCENRI